MASFLLFMQKLQPRPLRPADIVTTPTGRRAFVVDTHPKDHECTVEWIEDGERARFRDCLLTRTE